MRVNPPFVITAFADARSSMKASSLKGFRITLP